MPTLTDVYRHYTGDLNAHQRTIGAHFARLEPRRMRIVAARMAGRSMDAIATEEGIGKGSAQSVIQAAMEHIRKAIAGEPRYKSRRTLHRKKKGE